MSGVYIVRGAANFCNLSAYSRRVSRAVFLALQPTCKFSRAAKTAELQRQPRTHPRVGVTERRRSRPVHVGGRELGRSVVDQHCVLIEESPPRLSFSRCHRHQRKKKYPQAAQNKRCNRYHLDTAVPHCCCLLRFTFLGSDGCGMVARIVRVLGLAVRCTLTGCHRKPLTLLPGLTAPAPTGNWSLPIPQPALRPKIWVTQHRQPPCRLR